MCLKVEILYFCFLLLLKILSLFGEFFGQLYLINHLKISLEILLLVSTVLLLCKAFPHDRIISRKWSQS